MMRGWIVVLFVAGLTACGQKGGGGGDTKFLIPWHDSNGKYELEEVTIETLASPTELRGEAAEVYSRASFNDSGFNGSIARPHVTKSGSLYIPLDSESATAIAVYAQFDRLYKYEKQQKSVGQLNWPRRVGIETNVTGPDVFAHNNAHYFTSLDVIGVVPFTRDGLVPVALNHGILAHEHFHSHFQAQVLNVINRAKAQPIVSALEAMFYPFFFPEEAAAAKLDTKSPRDLNDLVLRGWNEGLADLFAGIYQNNPDFFKPSLPFLSSARDLDASPGNFWTAEQIPGEFQGKSADAQTGLAYVQGTALARLMYHIANNGTESPQALSARIMAKLPAFAQAFGPTIESKIMNFEDVVPVLLEGYELNSDVCNELNKVLQKVTLKRSFAKCGL